MRQITSCTNEQEDLRVSPGAGESGTRSKPQCPLESSERDYSKPTSKSGQAFSSPPIQIRHQRVITRFIIRAANPPRYSKKEPASAGEACAIATSNFQSWNQQSDPEGGNLQCCYKISESGQWVNAHRSAPCRRSFASVDVDGHRAGLSYCAGCARHRQGDLRSGRLRCLGI